jgi:hypothetical protein
MEEQPDSDAQPVEVQEAEPQEEQEQQEPIRDVETFWSRLDDVLQHLESQPQPGTKPVRSFIYQPELLSISSQDDMGAETENATNPFFFNTFTIRLTKPCLNVKGLQLLRCSFPTPVTNLPNEECVFWYYRFPKYVSGTTFIPGNLVIDPANGNFYIAKTSALNLPPNANPANWASVGTVAPNTGTTGAITAIAPAISLTFTSITTSAPYFVFYFTTTNPSAVSLGVTFTVSGATSAGFNGTFTSSGTQGTGPGTWAIICTNALQIPPGVSSGGSIVAGGTTYTATSTAGLYVGVPVTITGATTSAYNGTFDTITAVTSTSFTISDGLSGASSKATWTAAPVTQPYLYMIRLQPSWLPPELVGTQYAYNRTFTDYADLVSELNKACVADPLGSPFTDPIAEAFKYLANDISFSYNQTYNKIAMTGGNADSYYLPAGYSDPNIFDRNNPNAAEALLEADTTQALDSGAYAIGDYAGQGQPYTPNRTLNMRLGWTWNGNTASIPNYKNQFRPVPYYVFNYAGGGTQTVNVLATLVNNAPSYACLVNTATVIVFLDAVGGSSQDSTGAGGVLGSVPLNIQNNGVGFFDKVLSQKLTKIPSQLQELRFTFKDEQGNPFMMPNSAVVNLEIGVEY